MMKLSELRKEKNISQEKLAHKLYVPVTTIRNWEHEKSIPSIEDIRKMAEIFEINVENMFAIFMPENMFADNKEDMERKAYNILQEVFNSTEDSIQFISFSAMMTIFPATSGIITFEDEAFRFDTIEANLFDGTAVMFSDRHRNIVILTVRNILSVRPVSSKHGVYIFELEIACPVFETCVKFIPQKFSQRIRVLFF